MAIRSSSGFSHLRPWYFTFLYGRTKHNIHNWEGGRKENKQHGLGLVPSARREKFVTLLRSFLCICGLARACIRVKFPQSHQQRWLILSRWPTRPLSLHALASGSLLLTALFSRLTYSVDWFLLFPASFCSLWDLPFLVFFRPRGKSRAQALCVGFAPKQTKGSSDWHPHPHPQKWMPPIVWHE